MIFQGCDNPFDDFLMGSLHGFDGQIRIFNPNTGKLIKEFIPVPLDSVLTGAKKAGKKVEVAKEKDTNQNKKLNLWNF